MPAHDKTGPLGTGLIGRGRGGCQDKTSPSPAKEFGRGECGGRGRGRGRRCCQTDSQEQSASAPEEEASFLKERIATLQTRLDALTKNKSGT